MENKALRHRITFENWSIILIKNRNIVNYNLSFIDRGQYIEEWSSRSVVLLLDPCGCYIRKISGVTLVGNDETDNALFSLKLKFVCGILRPL